MTPVTRADAESDGSELEQHAQRRRAHPDGFPVVDVERNQMQRGSVALLEPLQRRCRLRLPRGCHHVIAGRKHLWLRSMQTHQPVVPDENASLSPGRKQKESAIGEPV